MSRKHSEVEKPWLRGLVEFLAVVIATILVWSQLDRVFFPIGHHWDGRLPVVLAVLVLCIWALTEASRRVLRRSLGKDPRSGTERASPFWWRAVLTGSALYLVVLSFPLSQRTLTLGTPEVLAGWGADTHVVMLSWHNPGLVQQSVHEFTLGYADRMIMDCNQGPENRVDFILRDTLAVYLLPSGDTEYRGILEEIRGGGRLHVPRVASGTLSGRYADECEEFYATMAVSAPLAVPPRQSLSVAIAFPGRLAAVESETSWQTRQRRIETDDPFLWSDVPFYRPRLDDPAFAEHPWAKYLSPEPLVEELSFFRHMDPMPRDAWATNHVVPFSLLMLRWGTATDASGAAFVLDYEEQRTWVAMTRDIPFPLVCCSWEFLPMVTRLAELTDVPSETMRSVGLKYEAIEERGWTPPDETAPN